MVKILGIIGGGQLGSLLSLAAKKLNIKTVIFSDDEDAPGQKFSDEFIYGKYYDQEKIDSFVNKVDLITFEFENLIVNFIKNETNTKMNFDKIINIIESIIKADPTDGLWENNRTDEDQLGAKYSELEWAMNYRENNMHGKENLSKKEIKILSIYDDNHKKNKHKMTTIPICKIPENLKNE